MLHPALTATHIPPHPLLLVCAGDGWALLSGPVRLPALVDPALQVGAKTLADHGETQRRGVDLHDSPCNRYMGRKPQANDSVGHPSAREEPDITASDQPLVGHSRHHWLVPSPMPLLHVCVSCDASKTPLPGLSGGAVGMRGRSWRPWMTGTTRACSSNTSTPWCRAR